MAGTADQGCFWWHAVVWCAAGNHGIPKRFAVMILVPRKLRPVPKAAAMTIPQALGTLIGFAFDTRCCQLNDSGHTLNERSNMMLSEQSGPLRQWARLGVLTLAVAIVPWGTLNAGEDDASELQWSLDAAVLSGEITQDQAQERWDRYLRSLDANEQDAEEVTGASEQDAEDDGQRVAHMNREETTHDSPGDPIAELQRHSAMIEQAVESGTVSREEANERLEGMRREMTAHAD